MSREAVVEHEDVKFVCGEELVELPFISVATLGLEERSRLVLRNALSKRTNQLVFVEDDQPAQIVLLDHDNSKAKTLLEAFRANHPSTPLIGLGKQDTELTVNASLSKPLNLEQLLATIIELADPGLKQTKNMITDDKIAKAMQALENKNIAKSLHKRAEQKQAKSAVTRAMPGKVDEMCFDPERFVLGSILNVLNQIAENRQIAVVSCWGDHSIVVDPRQAKISTDLSDNQIRALAIVPLDDKSSMPINVEFYNAGEVNDTLDAILADKAQRHFEQEPFLWNLGLMTCRGRIPAEFTVCNRHYLRRWPNLTRMNVPANAMRILAYWSQQPCSLMDIKEQLDLPLPDIFSVFTAAYAAGLTGEAKRRSDQILQVRELDDHNKRGLMGAIISRLRGRKKQQLSKSA